MKEHRKMPVALTIAGSDSGGGAGIQADLKTFASLGVHGTAAITCITAQNPKCVKGIQACMPDILRLQLEAVCDGFSPKAVKTGMLYSAPLILEVVEFFRRNPGPALVVDPVMVSTSGARLLKPEAVKALVTHLLPLATLVTPNLQEAELLVGEPLETVQDLREAARFLQKLFGCSALVKGGHLRGLKEAVDIYYDGKREWLLSAPFVRKVSTHGTGCTYSAAIAAHLARGFSLPNSVRKSKDYITAAIRQSRYAGEHSVLNSFWRGNR